MSSQAFHSFEYNLVDVDRLIQSHGLLKGVGQGRRGLGHVTRSGVVMLCAAWEMYCEQLAVEAATYLSSKVRLPTKLPLAVQKELSKSVKESKHELKPLQLSGGGWKSVHVDHAENLAGWMNAPKSTNVNDLFQKVVGIARLSDCWSIGAAEIDAFVEVRGDIAHRGRHAAYVVIGGLGYYHQQVTATAVETDNAVREYLIANTPGGRNPWRATRSRASR